MKLFFKSNIALICLLFGSMSQANSDLKLEVTTHLLGQYNLIQTKKGTCSPTLKSSLAFVKSENDDMLGFYGSTNDLGVVQQFYLNQFNAGSFSKVINDIVTGKAYEVLTYNSTYLNDSGTFSLSYSSKLTPVDSLNTLLEEKETNLFFNADTSKLSFVKKKYLNGSGDPSYEAFCIYKKK